MAPRPARIAAALLAALLAALVPVLGAAPAQAADGYKYWNYFHVQAGKYVFAQTGPADFQPKDGTVEAYRYGLSSTAAGLQPRTDATTYTAEAICKGTEKEAGQKLVGVLIDYGTAADADGGTAPPKPRAACAAVASDANGQQVLSAVADVRVDKGLTCGIDGYPVKGCSVTVKNPPAAGTEQSVAFTLPKAATPDQATSSSQPAQQSDDGGFPWTLVVVVVVIVLLAGAALALARRNRTV